MIADSGAATQLAWVGSGIAAVLLAAGMLAGSPATVHAAIGLLGAIFVLRQDTRLLLAAPYGVGLLLIDDLANQTIELRGVSLIGPAVIGARTGAVLAAAALGACAAAIAALAVTAAPGRSVGVTALGALAVVAAFAAIVRPARRRYGTSGAEDRPGAPPQSTPREGSTSPTE